MPSGVTLLKKRYTKERFDEFYTPLKCVEDEIMSYPKEVWEDKVVYCPCDSNSSAFYKVFKDNFKTLGLKKLICSCIDGNYVEIIDPSNDTWHSLEGDFFFEPGDFRSFACRKFWREADIVVTNPPFSLFRNFWDMVIENDKSYLLIGYGAVTANVKVTREILKGNCRAGNTSIPYDFEVPRHYLGKVETAYEEDGKVYAQVNCIWYTNLPTNPKPKLQRDREDIDQFISSCERFVKFPEVVRINKLADIPSNYEGVMAVPITFFKIWNEEQFEILGLNGYVGSTQGLEILDHKDGKSSFGRFFIRLLRD